MGTCIRPTTAWFSRRLVLLAAATIGLAARVAAAEDPRADPASIVATPRKPSVSHSYQTWAGYTAQGTLRDPVFAFVDLVAGFYEADSERLAAIRHAIADDTHGAELEKLLADLTGEGWQLGGETLKTSPRGYDADHPRIALLRHKSMTLGKDYGFEPVIHTPELLDRVRDDWRAVRPFLDWVAAHTH